MLFRNIFEKNSIRCILDKTLRLLLFATDNFLKNRYNFAACCWSVRTHITKQEKILA